MKPEHEIKPNVSFGPSETYVAVSELVILLQIYLTHFATSKNDVL